MKFLANENFPLVSVRKLRTEGFDVTAVIEDSPGAKDRQVLTQAYDESRIILTFDRDYGELIYRHKLPIPAGIIYLRFDPLTPQEPAAYVLQVLAAQNIILTDKFTVTRRDRIRQRNLPVEG